MNLLKSFCLAALASFAVGSFAQDNQAPKIAVTLPSAGKAGAIVKGTITLTFADGLHGYQNPPSNPDLIPVTITTTTKGVILKKIAYPAGKSESVGGDPTLVKVYEGTIKIPVTVTLPKKHGKLEIKFDANYQECNSTSCYPPADVFASATVKVK